MDYFLLLLVPLAFVCEFVDSSLGGGYGTILTPVLLLMGYEPMQIVPAVLLSEFVTGLTAAFFHHSENNVNLHPRSPDAKVAFVLSLFAVVGTLAAVMLAVKLSPHMLKLIIGSIVLLMGIVILANLGRKPKLSWGRIMVLGTVASFNKGLSGGGYGPLVMGGQVLSGVGVKNAVGITSFSEGVTCLLGVGLYIVFKDSIDWTLAPWLMAGAVLSIPLAATTLKRLPENVVKVSIAVFVCVLGIITLYNALA
ncbi:MAG: sulfite exporter TauE/SafE family protein [Candidatus Alcyoniella australis]|nr:sulfite exporter TauE/SafE family protein [Candidatus Alcyoniella australis]